MAELLLIGPLLALGNYLGTYAWGAWRNRQANREYTWEAEQLITAVGNLGNYAKYQSEELRRINPDQTLSLHALGMRC